MKLKHENKEYHSKVINTMIYYKFPHLLYSKSGLATKDKDVFMVILCIHDIHVVRLAIYSYTNKSR